MNSASSSKSLRIAFMGTPDFAVPALQALIDSAHEVVCVYTQPPRPKGRGHQVQVTPVDHLASTHAIPVYTPASLKKDQAAQDEFKAHDLDVAVVAAYGLLLPPAVLQAPRFGCLNIHASLLPRWRGASPIQHAIWKGDTQSGVTIMQMDEGLDTGAMIEKGVIDIDDHTTAQSLHDALGDLGARMIVDVLDKIAVSGKPDAETQNDDQSCYAPLLQKQDGQVDWAQSAAEIGRQIRALNPWPGVWTMAGGKRLKILQAAPVAGQETKGAAGTVIDQQGHIACGSQSVLQLQKVQPESAKPMDVQSAINGNYLKINDILG